MAERVSATGTRTRAKVGNAIKVSQSRITDSPQHHGVGNSGAPFSPLSLFPVHNNTKKLNSTQLNLIQSLQFLTSDPQFPPTASPGPSMCSSHISNWESRGYPGARRTFSVRFRRSACSILCVEGESSCWGRGGDVALSRSIDEQTKVLKEQRMSERRSGEMGEDEEESR